ncbi:39S ribosomal protein [Sarcoptes scabiei]|nr:39S ribosomal protein [Sarcoptes scabiei]
MMMMIRSLATKSRSFLQSIEIIIISLTQDLLSSLLQFKEKLIPRNSKKKGQKFKDCEFRPYQRERLEENANKFGDRHTCSMKCIVIDLILTVARRERKEFIFLHHTITIMNDENLKKLKKK